MLSVWLAMFVLLSANVCSAQLPTCSNRVIREVAKRAGCTIGDSRCWLSKGGMCTDYIQKMAGQADKPVQLKRQVSPEDVRKGDIAQFNSRAHFAYIEKVIKDKNGKPVAIDVSEYNYGTCWVDFSTMVTDNYKKVSKRLNIPLNKIDGGFLRPR